MSKKFNLDNPANKFINTKQGKGTDNTQQADNTHHTADAEETKSKRLNLLVKPSVLANFKKIATMEQTSVNDLINTLMESHITDNKERIDLYDKVFKENDTK